MIDPAALWNAATGVVYVLLGAWVLRVGRGRIGVPAFATFAVALGVSVVVENAFAPYATGSASPLGWRVLRDTSVAIAAIGVLVVAWRFPKPLEREEWRLVLPAALAPVAVIGHTLWISAESGAVTRTAFLGASFAAVCLLALRFRRAKNAALRPSFALLATALAIYPTYAVVAPLFFLGVGGTESWVVGPLLLLAVSVVLWSWNMGVPLGRQVAWSILVAGLTAMVVGALTEVGTFARQAGWGLARSAGVAVLAYAILRHQLLGIDVKLRFAISKSTIAAIFIAVFFVASEAAQEFFGDTLGSTYVGIAAAGALVFALAPLQRVADRLAARAVPSPTTSAAPVAPPHRESLYRGAMRLALRDRILTREEELTLAHLAQELGVGAGRALEIRHEVEREGEAAGTGRA